jgi:hypothetical protein
MIEFGNLITGLDVSSIQRASWVVRYDRGILGHGIWPALACIRRIHGKSGNIYFNTPQALKLNEILQHREHPHLCGNPPSIEDHPMVAPHILMLVDWAGSYDYKGNREPYPSMTWSISLTFSMVSNREQESISCFPVKVLTVI